MNAIKNSPVEIDVPSFVNQHFRIEETDDPTKIKAHCAPEALREIFDNLTAIARHYSGAKIATIVFIAHGRHPVEIQIADYLDPQW